MKSTNTRSWALRHSQPHTPYISALTALIGCYNRLLKILTTPKVEYILGAILFIADYGACFLSQYEPNFTTGEWKHKDFASGGAKK